MQFLYLFCLSSFSWHFAILYCHTAKDGGQGLDLRHKPGFQSQFHHLPLCDLEPVNCLVSLLLSCQVENRIHTIRGPAEFTYLMAFLDSEAVYTLPNNYYFCFLRIHDI